MADTMESVSTAQSGAVSAGSDAWDGLKSMDPGDDVNLVNEIKALQADRGRGRHLSLTSACVSPSGRP